MHDANPIPAAPRFDALLLRLLGLLEDPQPATISAADATVQAMATAIGTRRRDRLGRAGITWLRQRWDALLFGGTSARYGRRGAAAAPGADDVADERQYEDHVRLLGLGSRA
jgi:hypothetical protein